MRKNNSIHFGLPWIGISLLVGLVIPFMVRLFTGVFPWPLSVAGGTGLVSFVFAIGMHQDNSGKKNLSETVPYDPERQIPVLKCSICT